jgi:hypothetical protein
VYRHNYHRRTSNYRDTTTALAVKSKRPNLLYILTISPVFTSPPSFLPPPPGPVRRVPLTNNISELFLTVCTLSSSSSSLTIYTVSSTSPSTRLQCESYAYCPISPQSFIPFSFRLRSPPPSSTHHDGDLRGGVRGGRVRGPRCAREERRTCNRPRNSRSPRSLTNTCSSSERRTRSRGSEIGEAVSVSAIAIVSFRGSLFYANMGWGGVGVAALGVETRSQDHPGSLN